MITYKAPFRKILCTKLSILLGLLISIFACNKKEDASDTSTANKKRDRYLIHKNIPAAQIDGLIWMRHNLGVDTKLEPNPKKIDSKWHGNYYQWGQKKPSGNGVANKATFFNPSNNPPNNTWNAGTEEKPIKTSSDPCPDGYRIPTVLEFERLIKATKTVNLGTFKSLNSNFGAAKLFVSKTDKQIYLTFPIQGFLKVNHQEVNEPPYTDRGVTSRGYASYYFSSFSSDSHFIRELFINQGTTLSITPGDRKNYAKANSSTIRCIAE
ncbi:hypothetical protein ACL9RF_05285 [Sphingobacterium sp. Mn56C]|uniref:hypothetical protein n=1 Tax=Sphingobacterium sp. Mn56C TaxID=3395261 RepID=UPI003BC44CD1